MTEWHHGVPRSAHGSGVALSPVAGMRRRAAAIAVELDRNGKGRGATDRLLPPRVTSVLRR